MSKYKLIKEYPGFQKVHNLNETQAVFASPERLKAATEASKEWSQTGPGYLEYWPKDETGPKGFPHPTGGGKNVLEIYDPSLRNPEVLKPMIFGDLLHGMKDDSEFNKLREQFKENYTPEALELIKKRKGKGDFYSDDSTLDAFIRGGITQYRGGNWLQKNPSLYSPKQLETLDEIMNYLKGSSNKQGMYEQSGFGLDLL